MKSRILLLLSITLIFSCEGLIEQDRYNYELENYTSPFQGTWNGIYNQGTFVLKVYKAGNIEVVRKFENGSETFYGQVYDSGVLNSVVSNNTGFILNGSLNTKNGTWMQSSSQGTWTVSKQ